MEKCYIIFVFLTFICGISAIGNYYLDDYCGSTINIGFNNQVRLRLTRSYNYPRNFRCEVTVKTDIGDRMMMYFKDLDIENTCSNDWLEMDDGQSRSSPYIGGGKKCGYSTPTRVYTTSGRYMTVYFQSDGSIQGKGFDMVITSFHTGYCYSWEFNCGNGRCIDNGLRCNGYNPCGDHTDCNILSSGGIAGIVIGSLALAAIIIVAVVVCRRRRGVIVRRTAMPGVATVHTTTVGGYAYNQPVPQSYAAPPPPYPGQPATTAQYPGTTAVQYPAPTTVQY